MFKQTAPSASPTSVNVSVVNSTTFSVTWGPVDCTHQNGEITGYTLELLKGERDLTYIPVPGNSEGGAYNITNVTVATVYSVRVAANTSAGAGVYSDAVTFMKPGS